MKRSQIAFHALLASAAVFCQSAQAALIYTPPDPANRLEGRIERIRNGSWSELLRPSGLEGQAVAGSSWGNGGGHKFKNSRGSGSWKNGSGGGKWSNSRPTWRNGSYSGGWANRGGSAWRNGGGDAWRNGGGGAFINW
ncbi:MAG: GrrA/OscA1 family cyclophane-containing rSAM-modified RiPP [Synechococcus sp.]